MEFNYNKEVKKDKSDSSDEMNRAVKGKAAIFGVLVIIGGLLLLGRNTGLLDATVSRIIFSWEMLLIVIGVVNILWRHSFWAGVIMAGTGVFFLLVNFYHMPFSTWQLFLPALLILLGVHMIFGVSRCRHRKPDFFCNKQVVGDDFFEDVAIFGGGERKIITPNLKGGRLTAIFGGSKIDLSRCDLCTTETPMIEIVHIFGGSTLLIPSDWNIKVEVVNIFGGYSDKRISNQTDGTKTLVIKGVTIFGGGEVRSF